MNSKEQRDMYLKSFADSCLCKCLSGDIKLITSMKSDIAALVYCILTSKADIPPYLTQLAKEAKARHLNEDDTTTES